jgi:hypothetical protein
MERTNADTMQFFRVQVEMGKNPSDFPVFSFDKYDPYRFSTQPFNGDTGIQFSLDCYTLPKSFDHGIWNGYGRVYYIFLLKLCRRMPEGSCKIPIIGKKDEPRRTVIEASNSIDPFRYILRKKVLSKGAPLGITGTADIACWFMECKVLFLLFQLNRFSVYENYIGFLHLGSQGSYNNPIYGNPARKNECFRCPATCYTAMGEIDLET